MRKIFTFLFSVLLVSVAFAQDRPEALIKKAEVKPVIDGVIDDVWATTDSLSIERDYDTANGAPTLGDAGQTWWKALWDEDGYYLLVNVTDDAYYPNYIAGSGLNAWEYDKPEIYFDVNYTLEDAMGPSSANSGHHQMAPDLTAAKEDGALNTEDNGRQHAFMVNEPNYVAEYFVPWSSLKDKDGVAVDIEGTIGFDVTINDSDPDNATRRRSVWANAGPDASESWVNMDACGMITFEGAEVIYVESITLSVDGDITSDNQKIQVMAEVLPENATSKKVVWQITTADGGIPRATISADGWITPVVDEVLKVMATDGTIIDSNELTISISGQNPTISELSYIKNGNFDVFNAETLAPGAPWSGGSSVVDGVLQITNTNGQGANPWDWTVGQNVYIPDYRKDEPFILKLKLWISEPDTVDVDFELIGDDYLRFGNTTDPKSADGRSQWRWAPLSTEPTMYEIAIDNFSGMDTRTQKFNIFAGLTNATVYVDSVSLVAVSDMGLVPVVQNSIESFKVYPNPVANKLYVDLSSVNTTVAIYNSVGIKMEETLVTGTHHMFDVSRYTKGLYFVKANNAVVKFIK